MRIQTRLLLSLGVVMLLAFTGLEIFSHKRIRDDVDREADQLAYQIRGVLMATRRVYHKQFLQSGLPLNEKNLGFLPAHAMRRISDDFPNWTDSSLTFNNVSDKPRNPANMANDSEMAVIHYFREHPEQIRWNDTFTGSDGILYHHFAWPIWAEKYCLKCHGLREEAPPYIREKYDAAFGHQVGDLLGIMSIKVSSKEIDKRIRADFVNNFGWHLMGFMLFFLISGHLIRRGVILPLERLHRDLNAVEQGQYLFREDFPDEEFGKVGRAFNSMVQAIQVHQAAIASQQIRFRSVVSSVADGVVAMDERGIIILWNHAATTIFGYSEEEILGRPVLELIPVRHRNAHEMALARVLEKGGIPSGICREYSGLRKDGEEFPLDISVSGWSEEKNRYFVAVVRDIRSRKKAEEALRRVHQELQESEFRFRAIFTHVGDGILVAELESRRFVMVNETMQRMIGYSQEELFSMVVDDIHPAKDLPMVIQEFQRIATVLGGRSHDIPVLRKDGTVFSAEITAAQVLIDNRPHVVGLFRDITQRLKLEEQLQQSRKMEAIGALSGGIAHNFNNILAIILGNAELAKRGISPADTVMDDILESAMRGKEMVRQLLTFSRRTPITNQLFPPGPVVREALRFMRSTLQPSLVLTGEIAEEGGMLHGDPTQFQQILINLLTNAGHALGDKGGVVRVKLEPVELDAKAAESYHMEPGPCFRLTVADNGPGMSEAVRARIFEPFYTTKEPGKGTGLGLSVVHGVVMEYRGAIVCDSAPGQGATFVLLLPRHVHPMSPSPGGERGAEILSRGGGKVLFVDDEPALATMSGQMLHALGYVPEIFQDPLLALARFEEDPHGFSVVITDQVMPGLSGLELAARIRARRKDLPILLCTGFSEVVSEENASALGLQGVFLKPVSLEDLARALGKCVQ